MDIKTSNVIKLIQITDTHIEDIKPQENLFADMDTSASLRNVVNKITSDEKHTDAVILTGDLVHEPNENAYQKLVQHLSPLNMPIFTLPGNHDDPSIMVKVMRSHGFNTSKLISLGPWVIILLDSRLKNQQCGKLTIDELEFLDTALRTSQHKHCLIALHHHPVSIESPWMDEMMLKDANEFLTHIDKFNNVRGIIWGHIHQQFESERNGVALLGTPSTCIQFIPQAKSYAKDNKPPAYRKIRLSYDGKITTQVVYLD